MIITDKKKVKQIAFLCAFIYFVSYITRINYGAIISEMVANTGLSKSTLSMALTGSFITYGIGQLVSGYFGDKFQPKNLVSVGLITSVLMNIIIPFCSNTLQMTVIWCINGFAQSFMWPPIVKLTSSVLSTDDYNKTSVTISRGSAFGTIFIYLISPVIIFISSWRSVFVFCAVLGLIGLVIWNKACPQIELKPVVKKESEQSNVTIKNAISPMVIFIMLAIIMQGILRDGITTWMPSFVSETYNIGSEISILTGVILPIFSILCYQLTLKIYNTKINNTLTCAGVIFAVGTLFSLFLCLFSDKTAVMSVVSMALLAGCMHGVNVLLICFLPPQLADQRRVSTVSGMLNCCTYIGSAISTYAIPLATEKAGWSVTLWIWLAAAAVGTVICFLCFPFWRKRTLR